MDTERLEVPASDPTTESSLFSAVDVNIHYDYFKAHRRASPIIPEVSLFLAVLENGIESYCKFLTDKSRRGRRLFKEAEDWFFNGDDDWFCSFENVCAITSIDADYVRRGLRRYKQTHSSPRYDLNNIPSRIVQNAA